MENKKLLKFLLKDLSELDELLSEKKENSFDELELEFLQTRVSGAKRMIQILHNREELKGDVVNESPENVTSEKPEEPVAEIKDEPVEKEIVAAKEPEVKEEIVETPVREPEIEKEEESKEPELVEVSDPEPELADEREIELQEEKVVDEANHRLGDSFSKEKSVNDLIDSENSNLEHKLSNRPVESIKKSIGINDRFQYIRELFEGNAEKFVKAVTELDEKEDISEAVDYLKQNFEWKKNETSLKFINLVKRRFSNE